MFRKIVAFFLCGFAILLPWRLRCLYVEFLGWVVQSFYLTYVVILKVIINELHKAQLDKAPDVK